MADNVLSEVNELSYTFEELNEDGQPKKLKLRGVFGKWGVLNGNRRNYSRNVMESAIGKVNDNLSERRMLGELDHPADAKVHLDKVSHVITKLDIQENGEIIGEAEVLPTAHGKILEQLIKSNVKLGISSRGFGSTKMVDGVNEVQDDYKLVTFDIVSDPSTPGAFPNAVYENQEHADNPAEVNEDFETTFDQFIEEYLEEGIELESVTKDYVCMDVDNNRFYIVEGEKDSYGTLNFHMSHDYHILIKNDGFNESVGINNANMQLIEDIYGDKISKKLKDKFFELGYSSETFKQSKEAF